MCEITDMNFEEKFEEIVDNVRDGDFISFDLEFTGLGLNYNEISLFDEPEQRYRNMRAAISDLLTLQMGISIFRYARGQDYKVATYVFYLFPRSFPYCQETFTCESRSIEFLAGQNFDFNKVFRHGITYARNSHDLNVKREIKSGRMLLRMKEDLSFEDKHVKEDVCRRVYEWLLHSSGFGEYVVDLTEYNPILRYIIRHHIETQFKLATSYVGSFKLKIMRGERSDRERNEELYDVVMGATRLIKEIVAMKKPIVGHNMLLDMMMFYKTFYGTLPSGYLTFKKEMMRIFPQVYDTKLLAFEMKKRVGYILDAPLSLQPLYDYFVKHLELSTFAEMPLIEIRPGFEFSANQIHDSGYDSYCTGFIYLQLAHMFTLWDPKADSICSTPVGNSPLCYFKFTEDFINRVNMMRGKIGHFNLAGDDPTVEKPNLLLVESAMGDELDHYELMKLCAKFDSADIRPIGPTQALVASSSQGRLKILQHELMCSWHFKASWYEPKEEEEDNGYMWYFGMGTLSLAAVLIAYFTLKRN